MKHVRGRRFYLKLKRARKTCADHVSSRTGWGDDLQNECQALDKKPKRANEYEVVQKLKQTKYKYKYETSIERGEGCTHFLVPGRYQ